MRLLLALLVILNATIGFAQVTPTSPTIHDDDDAAMVIIPPPKAAEKSKPLFGVDGMVGLSPWYQHNAGKAEQLNLRGRFRIDGWLNITKDGCLKVKARVTSGENFNNEWIYTGLGTDQVQTKIALRHLYVSAACLKNITIEAGAVPVRNFGYMGLADTGSIDGLQVTIQDEEHKRDWIVSIGNLSKEANLFDRKLGTINQASVQMRQGFGNDLSAYIALSDYENQIYSRAGLQWALNKYAEWMKSISGDVLFSNDSFLGVMGSLNVDVKKWNTRVSFTSINPSPSDRDRLAFMMKQFYGYGNNLHLETSRELSKSISVNGRIRIGDAGPLVLTGVTWKFAAAKKRKPKISYN